MISVCFATKEVSNIVAAFIDDYLSLHSIHELSIVNFHFVNE